MTPPDTPAVEAAFIATPDTVPVPGGGRYRWSDTAPHWTEIDADGTPMPATAPTSLTAKE